MKDLIAILGCAGFGVGCHLAWHPSLYFVLAAAMLLVAHLWPNQAAKEETR